MKFVLTRLSSPDSPFFKGTAVQCLWKLRRQVVNLETVLVCKMPARQWLAAQPTPDWDFKTSVSGHTIHFRRNGSCNKRNFIRAFNRAENRFATTF